MEGALLVALRLLLFGQLVEVLGSPGHDVAKQSDLNPPGDGASDRDVEEDLLGDLGPAGLDPGAAAGDDDDEAGEGPESAQHLHQGSGL